MPFIKPLPEWYAPGIEPPAELKTSGWKAGMKPPDDYFNWLQYTAFQALKELQERAQLKDEVASVADASLTQKGVVQLNDALDSMSNQQAATPSAVKQVNEKIIKHRDDLMPHVLMDGTKKYKYGFKLNVAKDGLTFVYEEVL